MRPHHRQPTAAPASICTLHDTRRDIRARTVGPELDVNPTAPIKYQQFYLGERELFGYAPRFAPNTVTFDNANRPYIQKNTLASGKHVITRSDQTTGGVVQTLDQNGQTFAHGEPVVFSLFPVLRGEGRGEGQGARDVECRVR